MKKKTNIIEKIRAISDSADVEQLIENSVINAGLDWIIERSVFHSEICDGDPDGTNKIGEIVKFNSLGGYTCGLSKFEETGYSSTEKNATCLSYTRHFLESAGRT